MPSKRKDPFRFYDPETIHKRKRQARANKASSANKMDIEEFAHREASVKSPPLKSSLIATSETIGDSGRGA
ncbi:hypothetical protein ACJ73_09547 [Blastomyces percursus]|uniref:Uncharacterized protein n=1 Tax=Blastomyces percursus TaxID=1658174 RepID=A0A1J9Q887_9EURO|nr:hypothetical protein ACJ73_09547 [Blastomyces percursus]